MNNTFDPSCLAARLPDLPLKQAPLVLRVSAMVSLVAGLAVVLPMLFVLITMALFMSGWRPSADQAIALTHALSVSNLVFDVAIMGFGGALVVSFALTNRRLKLRMEACRKAVSGLSASQLDAILAQPVLDRHVEEVVQRQLLDMFAPAHRPLTEAPADIATWRWLPALTASEKPAAMRFIDACSRWEDVLLPLFLCAVLLFISVLLYGGSVAVQLERWMSSPWFTALIFACLLPGLLLVAGLLSQARARFALRANKYRARLKSLPYPQLLALYESTQISPEVSAIVRAELIRRDRAAALRATSQDQAHE